MKMIDAQSWDPELRMELRRAAAEGAARLILSEGEEIVVVDADFWKLLEERAPSLTEAVSNLRRGLQ